MPENLAALDLPTLFLGRAVTQLLLTIAVAAITLRTGGRPAVLWLMGSVLATVAWVMLPTGLVDPTRPGGGYFGSLVVLVSMLQIQAVATFLGRALPWSIVVGVPAATLALAGVLGLDAHESGTMMAITLFAALAIVPILLARPLRTRTRPETQVMVALVVGLNLMAAGARVLVGLGAPHLLGAGPGAELATLLPLSGTIAAMVLMNIGFVAMIKDGTERKLETLALQDSLTRLWNRRGLAELGWSEVRRLQSAGRPSSIVVVDLDRFKSINDRWGHEFGDKALVHVAELLRHQCRGSDRAVRMGGEEFCLVLPGTDVTGARALVEHLRSRLDAEPFLPDSSSLSFSAGIARVGQGDTDLEAAIARADRALYRAKRDGRGRSVVETDTTLAA